MPSVLPCKSLTPQLGEFPTDQRVNYAYGMVMGVDDFRQEQVYHVERKRLNNRALHGYGVAYGLRVETDSADGPDVLRLRVKAGMAVDPHGRDIVVPEDQCVLINDWLKGRKADLDKAKMVDDKKRMRVCVALEYVDCYQRLVPVAGVPCAKDEETQAYSRIRESFALRLALRAPSPPGEPEQVAEYATRRFGDILEHIDVGDTLNAEGDLDRILALVGDIRVDPPKVPPLGADESLRIPAGRLHESMRRIIDRWTSDVRPRIIDETDRRIELACIRLTVKEVGGEYVYDRAGAVDVDHTVRPILLDTRALEELLISRGRDLQDVFEFATVNADETDTIDVAVHYPAELALVGVHDVNVAPVLAANGYRDQVRELEKQKVKLAVFVNDRPASRVEVKATGVKNAFTLQLTGVQPAEDQLIRVCVNSRLVDFVAGGPAGKLFDDLERGGTNWMSRWDNWLFSHAAFTGVEASRRFMNMRAIDERTLELWFHTDEPIKLDAKFFELVRITTANPPEVLKFTLAPGAANPSKIFTLKLNDQHKPFVDGDRLEFTFDAVKIGHGAGSLKKWITDNEIDILGWDGDKKVLAFEYVDIDKPPVVKVSHVFADLCLLNRSTIRAWLHFPVQKLYASHEEQPPSLSITLNGVKVNAYEVKRHKENPDLFDIVMRDFEGHPAFTEEELHDATIVVVFHLDRIRARGEPHEGRPLHQVIPRLPYLFIGANEPKDRPTITVRRLHCCCGGRFCHFVTTYNPDKYRVRLWFHTEIPLHLPKYVRMFRKGVLQDRPPRPLNDDGTPPAGALRFASLWEVFLDDNDPITWGEPIRFEFPVDDIHMADESTLEQYMVRRDVRFVCYDGQKYIRAFHIGYPPPPPPPPPPERPPRIEIPIDIVRTHLIDLMKDDPAIFRPLTDVVRADVPELVRVATETTLTNVVRTHVREAVRPAATEAVNEALATSGTELVTNVLNNQPRILSRSIAMAGRNAPQLATLRLVEGKGIAVSFDTQGQTPLKVTKLADVRLGFIEESAEGARQMRELSPPKPVRMEETGWFIPVDWAELREVVQDKRGHIVVDFGLRGMFVENTSVADLVEASGMTYRDQRPDPTGPRVAITIPFPQG